ncbi:MAG TPA: VCBS domain-containing protein [Allosphingosinicella sp.]|jgi:VCBS repeat-containing protein|nr:VCBS domain-containing protein [Allosphingosinicella sp.]
MSISKRGSHTPVGDNAPLGDNKSVGDLFNRFESGISAPAHDVDNPGPEIGISAPTPDDVGPAGEAPADDGTSSGDAGDSLLGLGTWESIPELTIADDDDGPTNQKGGGAAGDPTAANPASGNIGTLLTLGTNPDGSHFFTGIRNVDATLIGSKWGTTNLTFSFPTNGSNYNGSVPIYDGVGNYHIDLGTQQQAAARAALAQLSAVSGLTFTEITETDTVHANIRISQTADQDVPSAYGTFPSDKVIASGDIWFGRTSQPYYDLAFKGTWGFATMMHEIGHTMGLKHGHQDYTNSDLSSSFGTSPRFGTQSLTPDRDGQAWSLMTYTPAPFTNSNFAGEKINQPQTYMQYDLAALQYLYGANFNTNSGDSVYTFSQTTGEMFINGVGQGAPAGNKIFLTIWDGGGNDTIDASNYANGVTIDLRPGEFSTVDQAQLANNLAYQGLVNLAPGNIAMSLLYNNDARSLIENATGGVGNDVFVGNTANNILDGGAGSDGVVFTHTTGVNVTLNDTNTDVIVTHDGETDTLRSIENIGGTIGNDTITGNSQDNVLTGGMGGADVLSGGDGNDRLIGGGFTTTTTFSAPSQPDITKPQATNNSSIATAVATAGFFDVDANPDITNATSIPHATINATAFGGSVEYYRIDVTVAGSTAIFDIDGGGTLDDSILELVNSGGTLLATNDTGTGDVTFPGHDDAYLTFTFNTVGTFYIRVGRFISNTVAQPLIAGQTYQLNISLQNAAVVTTTVTANNTSSLVADGGAGNDVLLGTIASDTLNGGADNDTASFVNAFSGGSTTGVTVDLNVQGVAQNTVAAGNDILIGIENLIGSALNDTLTGDGNDNFIEGGLGNDTLVGGLGNDTASYAGATAGATVSLALQGAGQNTVNAGTDTLSGFENLLGSGFNDSLTGDANANTLTGGAGDDTLNPGANAGGIVDLLDGGIGTDTASFAGIASGVTATLNGAVDSTATIAGLAIATLRSIENLTGGSGADILTGDGNANVIEGGLGNDTLSGGLGVDTLYFSGSTAVTVNLATLTAQNTGWGSDTISNFENVRTGSGADNVTGDGNDNIFFDGGGNDTYSGAAGSDTVDYSAATSTVTVNLNTTTAQNTGTSGGSDTITNVENVVGAASFANTLTGNTLVNRLTGGSAVDVMQGNNGADVIFGNAGNDVLLGGTTGALDDGSADTLEGGAGLDYLSGGQGNDILRGGDDDDTLVGGVGNTARQYFTGVDAGDDTYDGGDGSDTAIMVYDGRIGVGASIIGIAFDLRSLAGNSAITWNGVNVGSLTSIETLIFRGTNVNDNVGGTGSFDQLTGGAGDDVLDGWYGNDLLDGGLGNDILTGGEGLDTATYVNSTAGVNVDLRILVAQNTGGQGNDTLSGIEYLTGSAFGDTLRGDDDFNLLIDAGVGAGATALSQTDSLFGYGGNDSILATRGTPAANVATNINMDGGDGDDFIELRGGTLSVALAANAAGLSALGTTQGNVTYLVAGATSNDRNIDVVTVDGGAGSDRIILTGVASATINAGSGADLVSISMRGATSVNNYVITLGAGADILQLGVGSNAANSLDVAVTARTSRVTDFQIGDAGDKFELSNFLNFGLSGYTANSNAFASGHLRLTQSGSDLLVQTDRDAGGVTNVFVTVFAISNGYTGGFTAFNFDGFIGNLTLTGIGALNETITGATGNDVLGGGDGTDALLGLAGNDTLSGGNGDDTLTGGAGNDSLFGGTNLGDAGYDSAVFSGNVSDYQVNFVSPGVVQVIDLRAGSPDGTDTLSGIERVVFANDDYSVDPNTGVLTRINLPPVAVDDVNSAIEDGPVVSGSVATNDSDPDPGETANLTYALNGTVAGLAIGANGSYSFDPSNAAYQHLAVGATTNVVASYTVTDEYGGTDTGTLTITVTGTNDAPVVSGPVMASATEGGGLYTFNPLANSSDPDDGDGLVVIPVGPLPAGVSFVGGSAATINFSDYALGSVIGQHGWTDGSPGSPDNEIVDVSGNRMLRLANDPTSGDFAGPFSPAFAISAGEAAAPADTLSFSFVIRAVSNVADGSRLEIDLGSSDRDDRYNFMAIEYTATGLRLVQNTPTRTADVWQSDNFDWGGNVQLGALLDASVQHTIQVIFRAVDGSNNDIVEYYVDGVLVGTGSTFENLAEFHAGQPHGDAINSVNNVLFRAGDPALNPFPADGPGGNRQGFYIDDLAMSAYDSHQLQFNANDPAYDHLAAGATQLVTVNYNVADGHGGVTAASTVITVTGSNDGATISGVATGAVVESGVGPGNTPVPGTPTASGMLSVADVDDGETELTPVNAAGANGYGNFAVAADGGWTYTLDNNDADTQALYVGQVVTDTILVHSEDNSASQTITVTITGTNDAPVITNGPGAASGSVNEGISPSNLTPAGTAGGLEPAVNYDGQIVSLLAAHPDDMPAVLAGLQAQLPAGSNGLANAIAVMWDYVDDHFSYYDTVINEISGRLSAEYARYLVLGGAPLTGTAAKYAPDGGDGGTNPDRLQSLHDNLLGNLNLLGLNDKLRGPPNGSNPNPDESAYNQIIALLASYGLSDVVNRPYFGGYEGDANLATAYDQANGLLPPATGGQLTASDVDSDAVLTWSGTGTSVYGAFAITAGGAWTYNLDNLDPDTQALAAGMSAVETFTATVTDNHGATATTMVTVIVHGTNDAPIAVADTNAGTEDGALVTGTVATNDSDVDTGAVLSYALAAPVAGLTINPDGSYSFDPGDSAYDHIALGATQVVTANYIVSDGDGGSSTSTLTITVTGINDAPDAVNDTASAIEDGAVVLGSVAGNDTDIDDGATRSWALVGPVAGLTLDSAGNYVFNPLDPAYQHIALGATQTVLASYRVTDQHGATDVATLTITVAGTNDAPDAANDVNGAAEDGAIVTGNVGSNDTDIDDGATRSFALVGAPPAGLTFNPDGSYSFNPSNAAYQHLAAGATETLVVSYTISDGSATDTATLTITVNGTNDAPVAADDLNAAIEDGAVVTGTVATGDTDVDDGATRTYALSGSVAGLTINPNGSYSFDPASYDSIAAGATQIVTATYIVTDDHGATDTGTLTITVSGINDAPDAVNDTASAIEDGAVATGTVAANDIDVDAGDTRTYTLNAPVAGLTLNSDGSYSFNPANAAYQHIALGATQTVVATYTFADNNGASDTATLTITVTGTNDVPDAVADTIVATEDGPVVSGSLGVNDTDADDGATRTYLLIAPVTGLTLTPSGNYTFDPSSYDSIAAGSSVTLSTSYRVIDNNGATDTATISITIHGINDAPDAVNDVATAIEDGAVVTGNVSFNDVDADSGDSRTYAQFGAVAGLTINADGSYSFNPADPAYQHIRLGATEVVVATYTMTDGAGVTDTATLTITVSGRNDAPLALFDLATANEDGAIVIGNVGDNDVDVDDGAARSFIPAGPVPAGLTFNPDGSYIFDPSNAAYQHLAAGVTQAVILSYRITDQHGATGSSTLTITVTGTNDGPIAADDVASATEDGAAVTGNVGAGDSDADDGATLTYALNGTVAGLTIAGNGDYSFDPSNAAYQHLAQGATEIVVASYTVTDQFGATDNATLTITVAGANDAPVALDDGRTVNEDGGTITGNVGANDTDADDGATRSFAAVGPVPAGLSFNADGSYSFDSSDAAYQHLAQGVTELVTLTYTISDGLGGTDNATLTITVTGANDAPVAGDDVNAATEDGAVVTGNVGGNDADADTGATRTYALVGAAPAGLTFNPDGSYSFDPASYDSIAAGATQIVTVTYIATDQLGATDSATLTITVNGINDAPDAVNDGVGATEDGAVLTGNVGTNDTDADIGDTRTYALVAPAPAGLTFGADGSYVFNPLDPAYQHLAAGATQIIAVTYTLADNHGGSDTATLTITVTGTNDAPVAANDVNSAIEGGAAVTGNVGANDSDVDTGATRTYALNGPAPAGLTFNANGSYSFNPADAAYQSLAAGATQNVVAAYTVTDDQGATGTATLTITVTGVSHAPDAVNDVASATEDGAVVTGTVATNDSDADVGDTRTYTLNAPVAGLTLDSSGSYSFDPSSYDSLAAGVTQNVVATYTLTDGDGATDTATLTITVTGVNDGPDAVNDVAGAIEDGAVVTGTVATNDTDADAGDTRSYSLNAPVAGLTLDSNGSYSFDPSSYDSLAAGATQLVVATYTMTDGQGATDTATLTITVTGIDDAPVAHADAFVINEATVLSGNLLADNGSGADADVDDPAPTISAVNGLAGNVGSQITLSSGALLTVNANGTFTYNPNGAFNTTPASNSGASNLTVPDSFTYTLTGGGTATVSLTITGLDTNDILLGTSGADALDGGAGLDILIGLGGNDTYFIGDAGDQVLEATGQGFDAIYTSVSYALAGGTEIEWLSAAAATGMGAIALTGNEYTNYLLGNNAINILDGAGGADVLVGYGGNDTYYVDHAGDFVLENVGGGFDAVYTSATYTLSAGAEVEWLSSDATYGTGALNLTGNEFANTILGNQGANLLNGAGGADVLVGYGGNDTYYVDNPGDFVIENAGGGFDAVYTNSSFTLSVGAEIEWLATDLSYGTGAINLTGNEFANVILGNEGANIINGAGGTDVMVGYGGADTFAFTTALGVSNVDAIFDMTAGTDKIGLDDAIFTTIGALGALNANAFVIGGAAADASDRIVYNSATGELFYDADGLGGVAQVHFATLNAGLVLTASDFLVI